MFRRVADVDMSKPDTFIEHFAPRVKSGRAVDLGCGEREQSVLLATLGYTVDAVDRNRNITKTLQKFVRDKSLPITIHGMPIQDFLVRTPPAVFNVIVAMNILQWRVGPGEYLLHSQFPQLLRVLKSGGRMICSLTKLTRAREHEIATHAHGALGLTCAAIEQMLSGLKVLHYQRERTFVGDDNLAHGVLCHCDFVLEK